MAELPALSMHASAHSHDSNDPSPTVIEMAEAAAHPKGGNDSAPSGSLAHRVHHQIKKEKEQKAKRRPGERKGWHVKAFKTPKETALALAIASEKKAAQPIDKLALLGLISGIYLSLAGTFCLVVSQGVPGLVENYPGLQKLLLGLTFPIGLLFMVLLGSELFTGNAMYMMCGWLYGTVTWRHVLLNWVVVWITNFMGAAFGAYLFAYLTDVFTEDPWLTGVTTIAYNKTHTDMAVLFWRAIPCNILVNIALSIALLSEDVTGKTLGMIIPICAFATCGFEHCIANMYFVPVGLYYGANTTFGRFLYWNLIPVTCGNLIGGGLFMGGMWFYLYGFAVPEKEKPLDKTPIVRLSFYPKV